MPENFKNDTQKGIQCSIFLLTNPSNFIRNSIHILIKYISAVLSVLYFCKLFNMSCMSETIFFILMSIS